MSPDEKITKVKGVSDRRMALYRKFGGKCFYCEESITPEETTIDHVIPRSRGGKNIVENIVAACKLCNNAKGNRLPEEWDGKKPVIYERRPMIPIGRKYSFWEVGA